MIKWILAAVGVVAVSVFISVLHPETPRVGPRDVRTQERTTPARAEYQAVSPIRLLADPQSYDGRKVLVAGYVTLDFESSALHLDHEAYRAGLRKDAIWLDQPTWLTLADRNHLNRRYDLVAGTFDASGTGHMGAYSGALRNVQSIEPN